MILIACVEDRMGMMFNHRRLSRDREVVRDILEMCGAQFLYMEEYSAKLFEEPETGCLPGNIQITAEIPSGGLKGVYFFTERPQMIQESLTEKIVLYRWNRKYPADEFFSIDLSGWKLQNCEEFAGNSHKKITKEIYGR
ncbi:MAG: ribonuclease Z [Eubacteriales bacterium]|nr:ribonuclease Z [Eubacteriales bacterium]